MLCCVCTVLVDLYVVYVTCQLGRMVYPNTVNIINNQSITIIMEFYTN